MRRVHLKKTKKKKTCTVLQEGGPLVHSTHKTWQATTDHVSSTPWKPAARENGCTCDSWMGCRAKIRRWDRRL